MIEMSVGHPWDSWPAGPREFDEEAYHSLTCSDKFEVISGAQPWISDEGFKALDNGNPSIAVNDIIENCDASAFADFGLDNLTEHSQALALVNMIMKHGF